MIHPYVDFALSIMMVVALYLLESRRDLIKSAHGDSYPYMGAGLVILTATSLLNLYEKTHILSGIDFLSDPIFHQLVRWIGVVGGTVLVLRGLSTWLPSTEAEHRRDRAEMHRLTLLRQVEQLVLVESRIENVLQGTLDLIIEQFGVTGGAVLRYSNHRGRHYVNAGEASSSFYGSALAHARVSSEGWERYCSGAAAEQAGMIVRIADPPGPPALIVPIALDRKPVAFIVGWGDNVVLTEDDRRLFRLITDVIGRKIDADTVTTRLRFQEARDQWREGLMARMSSRASFGEVFTTFVNTLKQAVHLDLCSLILLDRSTEKVAIYSVGASGTLVVEKGLDLSGIEGLYRVALEAATPCREDWSTLTLWERSRRIRFPQLQTLLTVPVRAEGATAALLVGSNTPVACSLRETKYCESAAEVLCTHLRIETLRRRAANRTRQLSRVSALLAKLAAISEPAGMFQEVANLLRAELKVDIACVGSVREDRVTRYGRIVVCTPELDHAVAEILGALAPWERGAIAGKRHEIVTTSDLQGELVAENAGELVRERISAGLQVPIVTDGQTVAVITLVDLKGVHNRDVRSLDTPFVAAVAQALQARLSAMAVPQEHKLGTGSEHVRGAEPELRSRVKSSLSGILGSVELMRSRETVDYSDVERYLSIIDRSAHRIGAYVTEMETV